MMSGPDVLAASREDIENLYPDHPVFEIPEIPKSFQAAGSESLGSRFTSLLDSYVAALTRIVENLPRYERENIEMARYRVGKNLLHQTEEMRMFAETPAYTLEDLKILTGLLLEEERRSKILNVIIERCRKEEKFGRVVVPASDTDISKFLDLAGKGKYSYNPYSRI